MNSQYYPQGRSPPPLQHPIPTHAHYQIPEPPDTPVTNQDPQGYMRFASPANPQMHVRQQPPPQMYTGGPTGVPASPPQAGYPGYAAPQGFQSFAGQAGFPMINDATAQMGMQLGKNAMAAGQEYVEKNVS